METGRRNTVPQRRTSAAALKQQSLAFLAETLPPGWVSQPLAPALRGLRAGTLPSADILVISPRGRCHFLFVRAPEDRWWDGGPRRVPAEKFGAREAEMARQLRAAGHKARAIWGERDLRRALEAWGCPLLRPEGFGGCGRQAARREKAPPARSRPVRPVLHLGAFRTGRAQADG